MIKSIEEANKIAIRIRKLYQEKKISHENYLRTLFLLMMSPCMYFCQLGRIYGSKKFDISQSYSGPGSAANTIQTNNLILELKSG